MELKGSGGYWREVVELEGTSGQVVGSTSRGKWAHGLEQVYDHRRDQPHDVVKSNRAIRPLSGDLRCHASPVLEPGKKY